MCAQNTLQSYEKKYIYATLLDIILEKIIVLSFDVAFLFLIICICEKKNLPLHRNMRRCAHR
jgi:hypothetical protein